MAKTLKTITQDDTELENRRLTALTRHSLDVIAVLDADGIIRYKSPSVTRVLGWEPEELMGKPAADIVHPDDQAKLRKLLFDYSSKPGGMIATEFRCRHKDGSWRTLESMATNLMHDPDVRGIMVNSRDISLRKLHEVELRTSKDRFSGAFEHAAIGMALVALSGRWLKVNHALCELIGYSTEELLETSFQEITHPDDLDRDLANINLLLCGYISYYHMEKRYYHKKGHLIWAQLAVSLVRDNNDTPVHFISQIQDITEKKRAEERLIYDALHDGLTGLSNRAVLTNHLGIAFNRFQRNRNKTFALVLTDLDRFKNINDTMGHLAGDQVLMEAARRFQTVVRPEDTIARLGGDEFAILLDDICEENLPTRIAERLLETLKDPINIRGNAVDVRLSIGVVVVTPNHLTTEDIFRDADIALYRAKTSGRGNYQVFDMEMHARIRERMELESELRWAIERDELILHLQPIISLETGKIASFEALVRWQHPTRGLIPPGVFIPIAEDTGLIHDLGAWVTRACCGVVKLCPDRNPPPISINVSANEIARSSKGADGQAVLSYFEQVERIVREEDIPRHLLRFEITESVLIEDPEHSRQILQQLADNGYHLLLDDFGSGYSSLSYLQDLPFYQVKLDSSFTAKLERDGRSFRLFSGIVSLAHNIGLKVVAEGIETQEQLELAREAQCDFVQGFYTARPGTIEEATKLVRAQKAMRQAG